MCTGRVATSRSLLLLVLSSLVAGALLTANASQVSAATLTVNTLADNATDDGLCTLREAMTNANDDLATHDDCAAGTGVDTVTFSVAGTIVLGTPLPDTVDTDALTIDGGSTISVSGNNLVRPLFVGNSSSFAAPPATLHLRNITVTNGRSQFGDGGAIFVSYCMTLTLTNTTVSNSVAGGGDGGGGIYNAGVTTVTTSTLSGNSAAAGGAIYNVDFVLPGCPAPAVTVTGSTISGNSATTLVGGGGILNEGNAVSVLGTTITGNHADAAVGIGGGIHNAGDMTITDSSISNNTANGTNGSGGGIANPFGGSYTISGTTISGNATAGSGGGASLRQAAITNSTISGNATAGDGGGIYFFGGGSLDIATTTVGGATAATGNSAGGEGGGIWSDSDVNLATVTVGHNSAGDDGGGIYMGGPQHALDIEMSTIHSNTSTGDGGGIYSDGSVGMFNSTVSGNTSAGDGGGIWADSLSLGFSTVTLNTAGAAADGGGLFIDIAGAELRASIIANNSPEDCDNEDALLASLGSNLDSDDTCNLGVSGDKPGIPPRLAPLAANGGPTMTHALLFDSPAIDSVLPRADLPSSTCPPSPTTDQRSTTRPQDGNSDGVAVCDIGAFELAGVTATINDVTVVEGDSGTVDAVFTVTLSRASSGTVSVAFATADGTATAVADYQANGGTLTFAPTTTTQTITIRVVGDTIDEPNETFLVNLSGPIGGTLADAQGTGNILDDEGPIVPLAPTAGALPDTATTAVAGP